MPDTDNAVNCNSESITITMPDDVSMASITGISDELLHIIQDAFSARITVRGNNIYIEGDAVEVKQLSALFGDLSKVAAEGAVLDENTVRRSVSLMKSEELAPEELRKDVIIAHRGKCIRPKTAAQKHYVDSIRQNTITFGLGPAGTGKTYLAMACAVNALDKRTCGRIILTRPVVEAGENLGFLPGTLIEKVDPYMRPLYDALFDMMEAERAAKLIESGVIEVAPLAFMRGRTLNDSFIILDEAQNATPEQMKMFLTRLGFGSKMVITGDASQADLPQKARGLLQATKVLSGVRDIAFCNLTKKDVVRHSLVADIIAAYDKAENAHSEL